MGKVALVFCCMFVAFLPFEAVFMFEELPSAAKMAGLACLVVAVLAFVTGYRPRLSPGQ